MQKFNRNYSLTIQPKKYLPKAGATQNSALSLNTVSENTFGSAVGQVSGGLITVQYPLTLEFDINQANMTSTCFANFRIKNLNQATRNQIFRDWNLSNYIMPITLDAGYGNELTTIFSGSIIDASSMKEEGSTEIITDINAWSGGEAMTLAYANIQENGKVLKKDLITKLINNMTAYGVTLGKVSDYGDAAFPKYRADGLAWKQLKQIAGDDLFIYNNKVYCLKAGDLTASDSFIINSQSGMLGTPTKYQNLLNVELLFEPKIQIGQQCIIQSDVNTIYNNSIDSPYFVSGIRHVGIISGAQNGKCKTILTLNLTPEQGNIIAQKTL